MEVTKKIYISLAIFGVIFLGLVFLMIYPLAGEIKESSQNLILEGGALVELEKKSENLKKFQNFYNKEKTNFEKLEALFINSEEPIDFIEFLEEESRGASLSLQILPGSLQKLEEDSWPSVNFQLILTGSFSNFSKFLEKLESSPYLIEILNLNLRRLGEKDVKLTEFQWFSVGDVVATTIIKGYAK